MITVSGSGVVPLFSPSKYFGLYALCCVIFGAAFTYPVILVFLQLTGVLTSARLRAWRRYAIVSLVAVAAVITPSNDPFSFLAMAVPLLVFYEAPSWPAGSCTAKPDLMLRPSQLAPPTRRHVRVAVGVVWLLDAALQAQPASFTGDWWRNDLAQSVMGQPAIVNHSVFSLVHVIAPHAALWNSVVVVVQAVLGLALLLGRFERVAILASIPWALGIWWVGEGFGTLPTGFALAASGSPGPVVMYPLIGLLAWPGPRARSSASRSAPSPPRRRSVGAAGRPPGWSCGPARRFCRSPGVSRPGRCWSPTSKEYSGGQPGWLAAVAHGTESLARHHPAALNVTLAVVQVTVGVGILNPKTRRTALGVGIVVSFVYWCAFQYLGGLRRGPRHRSGHRTAHDFLAWSLWPRRAPVGAGRRHDTIRASGFPPRHPEGPARGTTNRRAGLGGTASKVRIASQ